MIAHSFAHWVGTALSQDTRRAGTGEPKYHGAMPVWERNHIIAIAAIAAQQNALAEHNAAIAAQQNAAIAAQNAEIDAIVAWHADSDMASTSAGNQEDIDNHEDIDVLAIDDMPMTTTSPSDGTWCEWMQDMVDAIPPCSVTCPPCFAFINKVTSIWRSPPCNQAAPQPVMRYGCIHERPSSQLWVIIHSRDEIERDMWINLISIRERIDGINVPQENIMHIMAEYGWHRTGYARFPGMPPYTRRAMCSHVHVDLTA